MKLGTRLTHVTIVVVAPYTGAWIETSWSNQAKRFKSVAPYTGAWIETEMLIATYAKLEVAPYTGAWIET